MVVDLVEIPYSYENFKRLYSEYLINDIATIKGVDGQVFQVYSDKSDNSDKSDESKRFIIFFEKTFKMYKIVSSSTSQNGNITLNEIFNKLDLVGFPCIDYSYDDDGKSSEEYFSSDLKTLPRLLISFNMY